MKGTPDRVRAVAARLLVHPILLAALGLGFCLGLTARAAEVVLVLRNGDRVTGIVAAENDRQVTLTTPYGPLSIPVGQIAAREQPPTPPAAPPVPATTPPPPPPPEPPKPSLLARILKNIHGNLRAGLDLGFGTKERQLYSLHADATHGWQRLQNTAEYNLAYGKTEDVVSANRMEGELRTAYELGSAKRLYLFNQAGAGTDQIRKIDLSYQEGAGLGYKLLTRTNLLLNFEAGGQYHEYQYSDRTRKDSIAVTFGENLTWTIAPGLVFKQRALYSPDVGDFQDYRLRVEASLSYPLWKSVTLSLNVVDLYDSRPPAGVKSNDLMIQSALGLTF